MSDYTEARYTLLHTGSQTCTNYGGRMTDDLSKYEALAEGYILELVAMVRQLRKDIRRDYGSLWEELARSIARAEAAEDENAKLREALKWLVDDVQDYEAWQRPCAALDAARAALGKE